MAGVTTEVAASFRPEPLSLSHSHRWRDHADLGERGAESEPSMNAKTDARRPHWAERALFIALLAASLLLRVSALDVFLTTDEPNWRDRSIAFHDGLVSGDLTATVQSEHPGVTAMWLGAAAVELDERLGPIELLPAGGASAPERRAVALPRALSGHHRMGPVPCGRSQLAGHSGDVLATPGVAAATSRLAGDRLCGCRSLLSCA